MNNYYFASQLIAERQSALAANLTYRARLRDARAARRAHAASADRPARASWLFSGRRAHAAA
jgi:hypothetical protein